MSLNSSYNPKEFEPLIYKNWQEQKVGHPEKQVESQNLFPENETYSILMPPPNLTGNLHAGHTFQHYLMDTLSRVAMQKGQKTLWYPGVDHAGLQLEGVIDKLIKKGEFDEEIGDRDLPKDKDEWPAFIKANDPDFWTELAWSKVNEWRDNQKNQASILGDIPDYDRNLFTLDEKNNRMVSYAFEEYWKDGLVYKDSYLINWSVGLQTALSDVSGEIEYEKRVDPFITFSYVLERVVLDGEVVFDLQESPNPPSLKEKSPPTPLTEGGVETNKFQKLSSILSKIKVSTVRPETVFGDIAIAMHPEKFEEILEEGLDKKEIQEIKKLIESGNLKLYYGINVLNVSNVVLILADEVEKDFGTGALKITPASDATDYQIFNKYLGGDFEMAVGRNGKLTEICGEEFVGLTVEEGRVLAIQKLVENGFVESPLKFPPVVEAMTPSPQGVVFEVKKSPPTPLTEGGVETSNILENPFNYQKAVSILKENYSDYEIDWNYEHNVSVCERTKTVIEPLISEEFFVSYDNVATSTGKNLKQHGLEGVAETNYFSEDYRERAENFIQNIKDWCISRNLLWGHRIPVWYNLAQNPNRKFYSYEEWQGSGEVQKEFFVGESLPKDLLEIENSEWVREEKIFDTWFSSCLWPLSTLNFLEGREDLKVLILHGFGADSSSNFFPWLKRSLEEKGFLVDLPDLPETHSPKEKTHVDFVLNNFEIDENTLIVGHSLGSVDALKLAEKTKNAGLFLVAGFTNPRDLKGGFEWPFEKTYDWNFDFDKIKENSGVIKIFSDLEDCYIPESEGRILKEKLGGELFEYVAEGTHFMQLTEENVLGEILQNFDNSICKNDFITYYPTQTMTTAKEIFYLWIVRMTVLGKYFTSKLPKDSKVYNKIPFENVVITPTVLDDKGRKMSKSLGNGLDPVEQIEKYSSDALRLSMMGGMIPNRNMKMGGSLADNLCEKYRNFGNKVWNIARFFEYQDSVRNNPSLQESPQTPLNEGGVEGVSGTKSLSPASVWILTKFVELEKSLESNLKDFELAHSISAFYDFIWNDFADWYVEYLKTDSSQLSFAKELYKQLIITLYPYSPFESEAIWKEFFGEEELLAFEIKDSTWGQNLLKEQKADSLEFENIIEFIQRLRSLRGLFAIDPVTPIEIYSNEDKLGEYLDFVRLLGRCEVKFETKKGLYEVNDLKYSFSIDILGFIKDKEAEIQRTKKLIESLNKQIGSLEKQLSNEGFLKNAGEEVVLEKKADLDKRKKELEQQEQKIQFLGV